MATKKVGIMEIRQLITLKIKGVSNRKIARIVGIHRNSVNTYVQLFKGDGRTYEQLLKLPDKDLTAMFPSTGTIEVKRYCDLSKQFEYFRKELKKTGCTRKILWTEYKQKHEHSYGYTQFNEHFNRWLVRKKVSGKFTHKAGDKVYVDYTGDKLHYIDKTTGELIAVEVFVGILPCSGYTFVEATATQKKEDFINSMNNCLQFFGGVPQALVPDNLKSAVTKGSKYSAILNKTFQDFAIHYGCAINPTRTYSPQDKALVEGAVKIVYSRIFYPLNKMDFFSLEDLNVELSKRLEKYNDYLLNDIDVSRAQQFITIEKSFLDPLPPNRYELKTFKKATVQQMGYIRLHEDKHYYSVPYNYVGKKVEVRYSSQTVEVYYGHQRIAIHKRNFQAGKYTTIESHLSSSHQFYNKWSPSYFEQLASVKGADVKEYVVNLIDQKIYPEVAYKQCLGIIHLSKSYGNKRLNAACKRGLKYHRFGYHIIVEILKNNMDNMEQDPPADQAEAESIPNHALIRGAEYFKKLLYQMNIL